MLKQRIFTILFLMPLTVAAILYLPTFYIGFIAGAFVLGCAYEWSDLFQFNYLEKGAYLTLMGAFLFLSLQLPIIWIIACALLFWVIMSMLVMAFDAGQHQASPSKFAASFLGLVLLVPFWLSLVWLSQQDRWLLLSLFLIVWVADIFAYFGGRQFGKRPLIPQVSPNKTWEGLLTGLFAVLAVGAGLYYSGLLDGGTGFSQYSWTWFPGLILLFAFAVLGDLFESMVKRIQGVKDSGRCLPGHGGLLDRMDSLFAAMPLFLFLCRTF